MQMLKRISLLVQTGKIGLKVKLILALRVIFNNFMSYTLTLMSNFMSDEKNQLSGQFHIARTFCPSNEKKLFRALIY